MELLLRFLKPPLGRDALLMRHGAWLRLRLSARKCNDHDSDGEHGHRRDQHQEGQGAEQQARSFGLRARLRFAPVALRQA